jgi:hypothetical protein
MSPKKQKLPHKHSSKYSEKRIQAAKEFHKTAHLQELVKWSEKQRYAHEIIARQERFPKTFKSLSMATCAFRSASNIEGSDLIVMPEGPPSGEKYFSFLRASFMTEDTQWQLARYTGTVPDFISGKSLKELAVFTKPVNAEHIFRFMKAWSDIAKILARENFVEAQYFRTDLCIEPVGLFIGNNKTIEHMIELLHHRQL